MGLNESISNYLALYLSIDPLALFLNKDTTASNNLLTFKTLWAHPWVWMNPTEINLALYLSIDPLALCLMWRHNCIEQPSYLRNFVVAHILLSLKRLHVFIYQAFPKKNQRSFFDMRRDRNSTYCRQIVIQRRKDGMIWNKLLNKMHNARIFTYP